MISGLLPVMPGGLLLDMILVTGAVATAHGAEEQADEKQGRE
jgi:hypothetical protein